MKYVSSTFLKVEKKKPKQLPEAFLFTWQTEET